MFWNRKSGHFPVLECPFPVLCVLLRKWFCPRTSRDRGFCPGTFAPALVSGQRDTGTRIFFCPGTKGQLDVPSRFVPGRPAGCPVPWKHYYVTDPDLTSCVFIFFSPQISILCIHVTSKFSIEWGHWEQKRIHTPYCHTDCSIFFHWSYFIYIINKSFIYIYRRYKYNCHLHKYLFSL